MQELEVAGEKKSSLEETLSKKDDLNGDLQAKLDELKVRQIFFLVKKDSSQSGVAVTYC